MREVGLGQRQGSSRDIALLKTLMMPSPMSLLENGIGANNADLEHHVESWTPLGIGAEYCKTDVTNAQRNKQAIETIQEMLGSVDIEQGPQPRRWTASMCQGNGSPVATAGFSEYGAWTIRWLQPLH